VRSIEIEPDSAIASSVNETIGLADEKSRRAMREPVTSISSSCASSAGDAVGQIAAATEMARASDRARRASADMNDSLLPP
jgi:hypothetical protein